MIVREGSDIMKSVKRGRGPSFMNGAGSVAAAIFGILWTVGALSIIPPQMGVIRVIFPLFGLVFIGMAVMNAVYNLKNASSKERYSEFDITDDTEEPDPLNRRFGSDPPDPDTGADSFCPWCGAKISADFEYCPKCGKRLP